MDGGSSTAFSLLMLQKPEIRVGEFAHPFTTSIPGLFPLKLRRFSKGKALGT